MVVAIIMLGTVTTVYWDDPAPAVPAGLTIQCIPCTFSTAYGIVSYPLATTAQGAFPDVHPGQWALAGLVVVYFVVLTGGFVGEAGRVDRHEACGLLECTADVHTLLIKNRPAPRSTCL